MREMAVVREKANLIVSVGVEVKNAACHVLHVDRNCKSISQMLLHLRSDNKFIGGTHRKNLGSCLVKMVFGPAVCLNHRLNRTVKHHL